MGLKLIGITCKRGERMKIGDLVKAKYEPGLWAWFDPMDRSCMDDDELDEYSCSHQG